MSRRQTRYALLVMDDGERVLDEKYDNPKARALAVHDLVFNNHSEAELCSDEITDPDEIIEWYRQEGFVYGFDIYTEEEAVTAPAPEQLFHVVTLYGDDDVQVATYVSEEDRRVGLITRAADNEITTIGDDATAEEALAAIAFDLDIQLFLVDAQPSQDDLAWY